MIAVSDPDTRAPGRVPAQLPDPACRRGADGDPSFPGPALVDAALHLLIEHLEQGVAVTDRSGRAHFLNRAARGFIRRGLLRLEGGCLRSGLAEDGAAFGRVIARCAGGAGAGSLRLVGEGGTLLIAASAIPAAAFPIPGNAVLLRLIDPAAARLPDRRVLQEHFGFTPAEAALAVDILAGNDLAASAAGRGVTLHTARSQLRRLFEKTGTRRQAELMRLLLLCPQPVAAILGAAPRKITSGSIHRANR